MMYLPPENLRAGRAVDEEREEARRVQHGILQ